jgi:hypothetical protein
MAFPIIPKYNATATSQSAPLSGDLQLAELGVNTATGKVYLKGNSGVVEVAGDKVSTSLLTTAATANGVPQLTGAGLISTSQIQALTTSQIADLTTSAVANKIPQLDGSGKIAVAQLPASVVGALIYQGTWVPNTSPVLASGVGTKGYYYVATADATITAVDGHTKILAGDIMAFNGSTWDLIHGATSEVISVNSQTPINGNVTLTAANVGAVATADLTTLAVSGKVPQLNGSGQIATAQLQIATTAQLGILKVGDNLTIDVAGRLSAIQGTYTLPVATDTVLGGVKSSASIEINGTTGVATVASAGTY